jgi:serine-protein kinase ATM
MAAFELHQNAGLSQYVFQGLIPAKSLEVNSSDSFSLNDDVGKLRDTKNDHAVVEMLLVKLQHFREAWATLSKERTSNISVDFFHIMVDLIVIASILPTLMGTERSQICKELVHSARQNWSLLQNFLELSGDAGFANANIAAAIVTGIRGSEVIVAEDPVLRGISYMVSPLLIRLLRNGETAQNCEKDDMDMVDINESFVSHSSQATSEKRSQTATRQDLPFATNSNYFQHEIVLQLLMYSSCIQAVRPAEENYIPSVIDYIVNLQPEELLASRSSLLLFLRSSSQSRFDVCRLLKAVAEACIQDYELERCEASLCLCLEVMTTLAELWVTDADDELHDVASDMYGWFITVPLGKSLAPSRVLINLATLLQTVLNLNLNYNNSVLPSSRTSLFEILRSGSNVVMFHVAEKISRIFDRFVLTEHTAILNDVIESLPNDSADLDGIALRLFVLAELAARWPTLLRPSVYHLFETSAHIPLSVPHAQSCLQKISSTLQLDSPRDLFVLFAPQLLYTWLETETLEAMSFSAFGFPTLSELISDVQNEVVGQIVMRANQDLMSRVSEIMKTKFDALLETSFPRAEAYSVARDISMPPSKGNASKSTESQVRKQLGTDKYLRLVSNTFPQIVADLFISLNEDREIERALTKRPEFDFAAKILQSMCHRSASNIILPPGQQPSFRAKYLLDELEFLCQRIGKDQYKMWTSPLVVFVSRSLLDSAVPALGPLHACSMLRKIRVLVAVSGPEVLQGYALEMLLQALQPYLTKFYCAEDALGIFWYLLEEGRAYLQQNLPFLCGLALTTLLSLSAFLSSPQDSTTQESHYLSTLSNTASFHKWFAEYLATFLTQIQTDADANAFKLLTSYAADARPPGRADKESVEGKFLLELLEARTSGRSMLSPAAFETSVQILCSSFTVPAKPEEDILGEDALAFRHVKVLCSLLANIDAAREFWVWSGESLGRAFAASGVVDRTLTMEHPRDLFPTADSGDGSMKTSNSLVMDSLRDLLRSDEYHAASLAEKTLQQVITQIACNRDLDYYQDCIDLNLIRALNWHPSPCPDMKASKKLGLKTNEYLMSNLPISSATWASQFMVSLTSSVKDDPLLASISPIVLGLPNLAFRIMPFIVHNILIGDNKDGQPRRQTVSQAFLDVLLDQSSSLAGRKRLVLSTLLYLRCQPMRKETTIADRSMWLDIDFGTAATAATSCAMYKSALMLLELQASQQMSPSNRSSRRSSVAKTKESPDLMRQIYQSLDDPDFFYGMQEDATLSSVMRKLSHEGDNFKNLSFQSAAFDSSVKTSDVDGSSGILRALISANMDGVARAVQAQLTPDIQKGGDTSVHASSTALNLHDWDLPVSPTASDSPSLLFQVLRAVNTLLDFAEVPKKLDGALLTLAKSVTKDHAIRDDLHRSMSTLAALTEMKEALCTRGPEELAAHWQKLANRGQWQETEK